MKTLPALCLLIFTCLPAARSQQLILDSTRFITGYHGWTELYNAIPTMDKGILFVGSDYGNPGGTIPYFFDTSENGNVLVAKIDSNQKISWIKIYGGSKSDGGGCAVQTPDGGYAVLCGTTSDDGDVTGFLGLVDIWVVRIDDTGKLLWEKCYGSSANDIGISIANTPDHGFILLGATDGSDHDVPFHYGDFFSNDWVVVKIDSTGNKQWSKDLGGTDDEDQTGTILAFDSCYYLVSSSNSHDHDCTDTSWHSGVTFPNENYYILKLDDTGKVLWDSSYGGSGACAGCGGDQLHSAFFDARDSTIICNGYTNSDDYMVTGYHGDQDMWVIKVSKNGTLIWEKALGSPNQESGMGICAARSDGYIAYGWTGPGPIGATDCWLFDMDNAGNEISNKIFGGTNYEDPYSIMPYKEGYVATGYSASVVFTEGSTYGNFDTGGGFITYIDTGDLAVKNINNYSELITVYPNPTKETFEIIPPEASGTITIVNTLGEPVYRKQIQQQNSKTEINTVGWADGVYIVQWQGENGNVLTTKLIKY